MFGMISWRVKQPEVPREYMWFCCGILFNIKEISVEIHILRSCRWQLRKYRMYPVSRVKPYITNWV